MSNIDRAKQFLPFNSLRGFYDLVNNAEKRIESRRRLTVDEVERLSFKINQIRKGELIEVTYYLVDGYIKLTGMVTFIDDVYKTIKIVDEIVPIKDIIDVVGENIKNIEDIYNE